MSGTYAVCHSAMLRCDAMESPERPTASSSGKPLTAVNLESAERCSVSAPQDSRIVYDVGVNPEMWAVAVHNIVTRHQAAA